MSDTKIWDVEDSTGKSYQVEGPVDATPDELFEAVQQLYFNDKQASVATPQGQAAAPVGVSAPDVPPQAVFGNGEQTVATKSLEEVPGAREHLEKLFFDGASYNDAKTDLAKTFPEVRFADASPAQWAENAAFARTPEGALHFRDNSPFAPINRATGVADPDTPTSISGEFGNAVVRSASNMANTAVGAAGLGADLVGADDTATSILDTYLNNQAAIAQKYPSGAPNAVDIDSMKSAGMWLSSTLGEQIPQLASMMGAGWAAGAATRKVLESGVRKMVDDQVAQGMTREAAEEFASKAIRNKILKAQAAGAAATSEVQETGSIYGDTYGQTGERKPWTSLLAGTAAASLDTVVPAHLLKKLGNGAEEAIVGGLVKRLGKEGASAFLMEGGTEALQTIIEQLPAGKVDWDQVIEAGLRGAVGGATAGTAVQGVQEMRRAPVEKVAGPDYPEMDGPSIVVPTAKRRTKAHREETAAAVESVKARVEHRISGWENAPNFQVEQNFNNIDGIDKNAIGAIVNDQVTINTENVIKEAKRRNVSPDVVVDAVVFHEGLGHHGLQEQFGELLDMHLANIFQNSEVYQQRVEKWLAKNPKAYDTETGVTEVRRGSKSFEVDTRNLRALEEILAEKSEKGELPTTFVNSVKNKVKEIGRKMGLKLQYSTREVETILAMAHAAVVSGKGRNVRDNGFATKYMNVGEKAKLGISTAANRIHSQIADARGSKTPEEIKEKFGWWKDRDGEWRTRISDAESGLVVDPVSNKTVLETLDTYPDKGKTLSRVLNHDKLFEAYPYLKNMFVEAKDIPGFLAAYHPSSQHISINPRLSSSGEDPRAVLLHEIQHAIQEREGWASGGNWHTALDQTLKTDEIVPAAEKLLEENHANLKILEEELDIMREAWRHPEIKKLAELYNTYIATPDRNLDIFNGKYRKAFDAFLAQEDKVLETIFNGDTKGYNLMYDALIFDGNAEESIKHKNNDLIQKWAATGDLEEDLRDHNLEELEKWVKSSQKIKREAYDWLFGEIEAREAELLKDTPQEELDKVGPIGSTEGRDMEYARVTRTNSTAASMVGERPEPKKLTDRDLTADRKLRRKVQEENIKDTIRILHEQGIDPESVGLPRYMMMSNPDKVELTPEEIAAMSPEELMESENAMHILEQMTKGYTPIVMSLDDLKREAEDRQIPESRIKSVSAGEVVRRLYMYDIAMSKLHDRVAQLYEKLQSGNFTQTDRANYLKTVFKMNELAGRIFEDQGEIGRALAAMKSIQFTHRRVKGVQETIAQIKQGSPFEALNDPDEFYKFAKSIQDQIEAAKTKASEKGKEFVGNALNLPRALMSSMDFSAPLRQGLFLIHKAAWWRSFFNMFRYFGSQRAYDDLMESITNRKNYPEMVRGNLALSNLGSKLTQREEQFMSEWAERLPIVGHLVKASERAYVGFLNKLRADVFDQLVAKLPEAYTTKQLKDITTFINAATGRGNLPKAMQSSTPVLNALFFSPRLMASRIKMGTVLVDPRTYTSMNPVARKEYIKSIMAVGSLALLVTSLAAAGGAEVEKDPRSSDFGKVKVGNTRYDILGGEGQYITLAARLVRNSYKTTDGKVKPYGIKYGQANRFDALTKFLTNKAAPIPSFVIDYLRGTTPVGKKFEMDEAILQRFTPMFIQDVMSNMSEDSLGKTVATTIASGLGVGTQTYSSVSLDTERDLEPPTDFQMESAEDGEYSNATALDGTVTLDSEAQKEWGRRLNFYYKEWMKDETSKPEWKTMSDDERREIIAEVRRDARKEAKADMLDVLGLVEDEGDE